MTKNPPKNPSDKDLAGEVFKIALSRAIFFPTAESYGAMAGFYDWGPVGNSLRQKVIGVWRKRFVAEAPNIFEISGRVVLPYAVLKASGHVDKFVDPQVECGKCKTAHRADHLIEDQEGIFVEGLTEEELTEIIRDKNLVCPKCKSTHLSDVTVFNTMFSLRVGAGEKTSPAFLRPETAQNIFLSFPRVQRGMRARLPFGIAQIGHSFRNEISPRRGLFRLREFEQMEVEVFTYRDPSCDPFEKPKCEDCSECLVNLYPGFDTVADFPLNLVTIEMQESKETSFVTINVEEAITRGIVPNQTMGYFLVKETQFLKALGIPASSLRLREMYEHERPFYSVSNFDMEILYSFGWKEAIGNAYRTDHDLGTHGRATEDPKSFQAEYEGKMVTPHVIEPSLGVDRITYAVLEHTFRDTEDRTYRWFSFPNSIAPYEVAVFPLLKKDQFIEKSREVFKAFQEERMVLIDISGRIGRRYARADEIGIPYCITIDYQTFEDASVTIRDRDSKAQIRIDIEKLPEGITKLLKGDSELSDLGTLL